MCQMCCWSSVGRVGKREKEVSGSFIGIVEDIFGSGWR
jgi:hypothetical protein